MKQGLKRLMGLLLSLAIVMGSVPTAVLAAPAQEKAPAAEETVTSEEQTPAETTPQENAEPADEASEEAEEAQPEAVAEPVAQAEEEVQGEAESETTEADAKALSKELQQYIREEIFLNGNTVIDVSKYNASVETVETAADDAIEANGSSELVEAQVGVDEDGDADVVVADVEPVMQLAIAEVGATGYEDDEKQQILDAYADYQASITGDYAQYFGVQCPFFTTEESAEDQVGYLLSIASIYLGDDGYYYSKDGTKQEASDIVATISAFTTANQFAVQYYGEQLISTKDEALEAIEGCETDIQKLLALNDWLAQHATFDMAYIMNSGKEEGEETLVAEDPQEHPKRQEIISVLYDQLYDQLYPMIYQQIYAQAYDQVLAQVKEENPDMSDEDAEAVADQQATAVADQEAPGQTEAYAQQYAEQMADGVIGAWEGNQFGLLTEAHENSGVCLGYAYAYAYLVQWAFPEIYMENGQFKDYKELNYEAETVEAKDENDETIIGDDGQPVMTTKYTWNADTPAMVDFVRINFDAEVRMLGEQSNFGEVHYWNAAKVDGEWYYIDPCYTDAYVEFMNRDRVETNGNMNHLYFMFSDDSARELYDGYMGEKEIETLYEGIATDTTYEDAWFAFAKSPTFAVDGKWYYYYDSTDMIEMKTNYDSIDEDEETEYKLVYHDGSQADSSAEFVTLVDFNNGQILKDGQMVDSDLLKELWEKQQEYIEKYPSLITSCAVSGGKLYFNIANCIMSYDLSSGELVKVKEYNKVSATRDKTNPFGGMAFSVVEDGTEGALTVTNSPIASMTIKDGNMYVDVATNYAYISGQEVVGSTTHEIKDDKGYGWEYEETNYNSEYSSYMEDIVAENPSYADQIGYEDQDNDNDEFIWTANFVDTIEMDHLAGSNHEYEAVTVDPFCGEDGFTENRCTTCGAIEADTREAAEGTALEHHYVKFHEVYYEKDDNGNYLEGDAYVCVICKDAQEEQPENMGSHNYNAVFEWAEDYSSATATLTCAACSTNKLDCLQGVEESEYTKQLSADDITITSKRDGACTEDGYVVYTATAEVDGKTYTDEQKVEAKAGEHTYGDVEFIWADDYSTCKASYKCTNGDDDHTGDNAVDATVTSEKTDPTCTEKGKTVYTATIQLNGKDVTDTKTVEIDALGHDYGEPEWTWSEDHQSATATFTCATCKESTEEKAEVKETSGNATCTEAGTMTYTATVTFEGKQYTDSKTVSVEALGHKYDEPTFKWSSDNKSATATYTCVRGDDTQTVDAVVTSETTKEATCTAKGEITYTATVSADKSLTGKESTGTKKVETDKLAHQYENGACTVCGTKATPDNVTSIQVANASTGVKVSWTKVSYADKYRVYRKTESGSWSRLKDISDVDGSKSSLVDTTAKSGTKYYYTVRAIIMDGSTEKLSPKYKTDITVLYLAQPSVSVSNAASGVTIKWDKVSGATGYRVYRAGLKDTSWTRIGTIKSGSTVSFTDKDAASGTTYKYTVRAVSGSTLSSYNTKVQIIRLAQPSVSLANAESGVTVKWGKITGATGYRVYRMSSKESSWTRIADISSGSTVSYTDKKASAGTTYKYTVRALSGSTLSSYNTKVQIKRLTQPSVSVAKASSGITVKWGKITGASGYRVYRRTSGGSWSRIATVKSGSTVSYTDKNAKKGTTYEYTVRAVSGDYLSSYKASKSIKR